MKVTQVLASAVGAVVAAVIASFFGVTGTIVGVAVGSIIATTATALVKSSLDRTTPALRQVVIDQNPLLRKVGGTASAGEVDRSGARLVSSSRAGSTGAHAADAVGAGGERAGADGTDAAGTPRSTVVPPPVRRRSRSARRVPARRWVLTGVAAAVVGLAVVTVIELAAGSPLAVLLGSSHATGSTSAGELVTGSPSKSTTTTTTSTTAPSSTTTTSTTAPSSTTTTTTTTPTASTSTTAPSATTTTTVPRSATTSTLPRAASSRSGTGA